MVQGEEKRNAMKQKDEEWNARKRKGHVPHESLSNISVSSTNGGDNGDDREVNEYKDTVLIR
jgi:hypothetical protein